MWELWVKYPHGWRWAVIGANTLADLMEDANLMTQTGHFEGGTEMRIISDEADRPGIVR